MNTYLVKVAVFIPAPREFEFRVIASNEATASARALRLFRKKVPRKKVKAWKINIALLVTDCSAYLGLPADIDSPEMPL